MQPKSLINSFVTNFSDEVGGKYYVRDVMTNARLGPHFKRAEAACWLAAVCNKIAGKNIYAAAHGPSFTLEDVND
jgi:hypothetical protein